jgi:guanylate kinase
LEELRRRLKGRNSETDEQIEDRLSRLQYELSHADIYDYVIVNENVDDAIQQLEDIIDK